MERLRRRYTIPTTTARRVRAPQNSSRGAEQHQNPSRGASDTPSTRPWLRFASGLPRLRQGPPPPENSRLRPGPDLPETHPRCVPDGIRFRKRLSPGTTGRTGPMVGRRMRLTVRERRISPQLQSKATAKGVHGKFSFRPFFLGIFRPLPVSTPLAGDRASLGPRKTGGRVFIELVVVRDAVLRDAPAASFRPRSA